jgi:hypothetical protein
MIITGIDMKSTADTLVIIFSWFNSIALGILFLDLRILHSVDISQQLDDILSVSSISIQPKSCMILSSILLFLLCSFLIQLALSSLELITQSVYFSTASFIVSVLIKP